MWHDAMGIIVFNYNTTIILKCNYLGIDKNRSSFLCVTKNLVDFVKISILIRAQISNGIKRANIWYMFIQFFVNFCYVSLLLLRNVAIEECFKAFYFFWKISVFLVFSLKSLSFCSALVALSRFHLPAKENVSFFFAKDLCKCLNNAFQNCIMFMFLF